MRRLPIAVSVLTALVATLWLAAFASAEVVGADGPARTVPAPNQILGAPPSAIAVRAADGVGAGTARVLDAKGAEVAAGNLGPQSDGTLGLGLPPLATGSYVVSWTAGNENGSYAFQVTDGQAIPATVVQPVVHAKLKSFEDAAVPWVPMIAVMVFAGTLGVRFLAAAPAFAGTSEATRAAVDRRLLRVSAVAVLVLVPTTVAGEAYDKGHYDYDALFSGLGDGGPGRLLLLRFVLTAVAAAIVVPLALRRARPSTALLGAALACGLGELALRHFPSRKLENPFRDIFQALMWVGHMWGSALWIGGLVALVALAVGRAVPAAERAAFWPVAIRRFSWVAVWSVAALILSGLWMYWVHVDGVEQLFTTVYGKTLVVKFAIFAVLLGVGALNQFVLMPRIDAARAAGNAPAVGTEVGRNFRRAIAAEVALGLAVLGVAGFLSGSSRNQELQADPEAFAQSAVVDGTTVRLIPSGFQPGLVDYVVKLDGPAPAADRPRTVALTFASPALGVNPQRATALQVGDATYRASGFYTAVVGEWQVGVSLDGSAPAQFTVPVTEKAPAPPRAPTKDVKWTTWAWGLAETALVAAVLLGAVRMSRRITEQRVAAAPPPGARPERLVDA